MADETTDDAGVLASQLLSETPDEAAKQIFDYAAERLGRKDVKLCLANGFWVVEVDGRQFCRRVLNESLDLAVAFLEGV